jgi:hypothetical protein
MPSVVLAPFRGRASAQPERFMQHITFHMMCKKVVKNGMKVSRMRDTKCLLFT